LPTLPLLLGLELPPLALAPVLLLPLPLTVVDGGLGAGLGGGGAAGLDGLAVFGGLVVLEACPAPPEELECEVLAWPLPPLALEAEVDPLVEDLGADRWGLAAWLDFEWPFDLPDPLEADPWPFWWRLPCS
jgi:hypothetical protein